MKKLPMPTLPGPKSPGRRGFLKRGLFGGAVLALGGLGYLGTRPTRRAAAASVKPLSVLTEDEYAIVHAIAARIVAPGPNAPSLDDLQAAWNVDQILSQVDADALKEVKQLLGLFDSALAGFLFGGRSRTFTELSPEEQDQVLREWQTSRLVIRRTGFTALRTLALAGYYASEKTWPLLGYPGPPSDFHDPNAQVWKGGGAPRPDGNGVFRPEER